MRELKATKSKAWRELQEGLKRSGAGQYTVNAVRNAGPVSPAKMAEILAKHVRETGKGMEEAFEELESWGYVETDE